MFKTLLPAMLLALASLAFCTMAHAQLGAPPVAAPTADVEVHQLPSTAKPVSFNADKATNAYLSRISGAARARSDAYFEGGYVLLVVDTLYALVVMGLLLWLKISARMRTIAQNVTWSRFWQVPIYFVMFFVLVTLATFPLSVYENFFREHAYGLSNQNFAQWLGDFGIQFAVSAIGATILITLLYAGIRAAKRGWWMWGAILTIAFLAFVMAIYPVFLAPLLNHYKPLPESPVKQQILSMARANGVPATDVYEYDASRQSDRISANVSGLFGTTRISVTDNLLQRGTPREAKAILGHEIGHYVMNHVIVNLLWLSIIYIVGFWFADRAFRFLTGLFGGNWDVRTVDDPAGLPVLYAAFAIYIFFATPFINTIIRTQEAQADMFGVNAAREPDAFATSVLKLSEYRKLDPSPLEEWIFFDHPSGRSRISMMMRWKAEHINDPDIKAGPVSPQ
jgi:STE24 endopeptidase